LEELSGETIAVFVEKYVRRPLAELLAEAPARDALPDLSIKQTTDSIIITIDGEELPISRPKDLRGAAEISSDDADALDALAQEPNASLDLTSTQLGFGFEAAE